MTDPHEERRLMKRNKEHYNRLFYVADAEYGIPTVCPCGGRIVEEVAGTDKVVFDTQPGRRFFVCKDYEPDGLHFKQPWVKGVHEEIKLLTKRVEESEKLLREVVDKLTVRVAELESFIRRDSNA